MFHFRYTDQESDDFLWDDSEGYTCAARARAQMAEPVPLFFHESGGVMPPFKPGRAGREWYDDWKGPE